MSRRPRPRRAAARSFWRWPRRVAAVVAVLALVLLVGRAVQSEMGPPLEPWHEFVPDEPRAPAIDAMDWAGWMAAENRVFAEVRAQVTDRLDPELRRPDDRYFTGSPVNPEHFAQDWNRSYILEPAGKPRGAVVLLHGLTDSPYSLRHIALRYRDLGFVAIGLRSPGHGTVPAGLTEAVWEDWLAATRLAVREARRRVGADAPLHLVGYSAGGAFALKYSLDAIEDPRLPRADRLVLISPMIGINSSARFAGLAALPALLPRFAKAAWLSILPEFNPFKYNSFPVNAARQAWRLTHAIDIEMTRLGDAGKLGGLPPILTFQSAMDFTVSASAVVTGLYARLPPNGSELVLFDLNRNTKFGPLLRNVFAAATDRMLPPAPRDWRLTVVTNTETDAEMKARTTEAGATAETVKALGIAYPRDVYSLSHVALPFPASDGLYGGQPDPADDFGVNLGAIGGHGEVGVLIISLDNLARMSWNPFYPYMLGRIEEGIPK
ncbi:MAG: alpha/beta hydrolase [Proteobacteria bacterium]|nr:alpha/beta hydrolase [Pseudomonadota bacterium]